jgi:hypothetical protein
MKRALLPLSVLLLAVPSLSWGEGFERGHALGGSFGTPSGGNLEYSYEFGSRAIYVSGGYWGSDDYGAQGGVTLERSGSQRKFFAVNLVGGKFHFRESESKDNVDWSYAGVEPYFRYRAFFIAPAITFGGGTFEWNNVSHDDYHGPLLTGRLGFLWRL